MSEDTTEVLETTEDELVDESPAEESLDYYKRENKKLRAESAKRRVENKDLKQLAEDASSWQKHLESQKTEMEKLAEENATLKAELSKNQKAILQRDLVSEFKLDTDLTEFITGEDEAEMRQKAEKLASKGALQKTSGPSDLRAGSRGTPVDKDSLVSTKDFFLELAKQGVMNT